MLTYDLNLVILQDPWEHNGSGVAYCYEQCPLGVYDPELFQWIALIDILNRPLWERASTICYGVPAGHELLLPRLASSDESPRVVLHYGLDTRRYLIYPEGQPWAALAKARLRDALGRARDLAIRLIELSNVAEQPE